MDESILLESVNKWKANIPYMYYKAVISYCWSFIGRKLDFYARQCFSSYWFIQKGLDNTKLLRNSTVSITNPGLNIIQNIWCFITRSVYNEGKPTKIYILCKKQPLVPGQKWRQVTLERCPYPYQAGTFQYWKDKTKYWRNKGIAKKTGTDVFRRYNVFSSHFFVQLQLFIISSNFGIVCTKSVLLCPIHKSLFDSSQSALFQRHLNFLWCNDCFAYCTNKHAPQICTFFSCV